LPKNCDVGRDKRFGAADEESDPMALCGLLRLDGERCGQRPKREPAHERTPVHWMIASARNRSVCGIVNPR
jgi:hypothetical protein